MKLIGEHKGYNLFQNEKDGRFEAYRTTLSKSVSINLKTGEEQRVGTAMDRMVLMATKFTAACDELDMRIKKRSIPRPKKDPGQTDLLFAIKEAQKENIIDMMNDDQKSGLYE